MWPSKNPLLVRLESLARKTGCFGFHHQWAGVESVSDSDRQDSKEHDIDDTTYWRSARNTTNIDLVHLVCCCVQRWRLEVDELRPRNPANLRPSPSVLTVKGRSRSPVPWHSCWASARLFQSAAANDYWYQQQRLYWLTWAFDSLDYHLEYSIPTRFAQPMERQRQQKIPS
jgi:hypothetical protein